MHTSLGREAIDRLEFQKICTNTVISDGSHVICYSSTGKKLMIRILFRNNIDILCPSSASKKNSGLWFIHFKYYYSLTLDVRKSAPGIS